MVMLCDKCKNFIYTDGVNIREGKIILKNEIGNAYVPIFCCNNCLESERSECYVLEKATPVLIEKRS